MGGYGEVGRRLGSFDAMQGMGTSFRERNFFPSGAKKSEGARYRSCWGMVQDVWHACIVRGSLACMDPWHVTGMHASCVDPWRVSSWRVMVATGAGVRK